MLGRGKMLGSNGRAADFNLIIRLQLLEDSGKPNTKRKKQMTLGTPNQVY